jgi:hypothetical protein
MSQRNIANQVRLVLGAGHRGSGIMADWQFQKDDPSANAVLEYALGVVGCTHGTSHSLLLSHITLPPNLPKTRISVQG